MTQGARYYFGSAITKRMQKTILKSVKIWWREAPWKIARFGKTECKDVNRSNTKHNLLHIHQYVMYRRRVPRSSKTNRKLLKSKLHKLLDHKVDEFS